MADLVESTATVDVEKTYLTKKNKASFAFAGFGQNMIIGLVNSYLLYFYTDIFVLPSAAITVIMIVARVWDALNDPIMGTIVDKTRTKWGKMRPYILFIAAPLALSTISLFLVFPNMPTGGRIAYAAFTYILWGMIYTVCDVPFWGLASSMTPNHKERVRFISMSRLVHSIGGVSPMLIIPIMTKLMPESKAYTVAGIFVGLLGGVLFTLAFTGTEERSYSAEKAPTLKDCLTFLKINKPLQSVVLANVLGFARALGVSAGMYVAVYIVGELKIGSLVLEGATLNTILVMGWGISGYIGMIFSPLICKKLSFKQIYYIGGTIGVIGSLALFFAGPNPFVIIAAFFVMGLPQGVIANITYMMIADSVDYVEWKTGKRAEGVTVSFQTLMNKLMTALQIGTVSIALMIIGFVQPDPVTKEKAVQDEFTKNGLFWLISILPAIGWFLSMIPIRFYKFVGEERETAQRELLARRQARAEQQQAEASAKEEE